jgi:hypothetical protein
LRFDALNVTPLKRCEKKISLAEKEKEKPVKESNPALLNIRFHVLIMCMDRKISLLAVTLLLLLLLLLLGSPLLFLRG